MVVRGIWEGCIILGLGLDENGLNNVACGDDGNGIKSKPLFFDTNDVGTIGKGGGDLELAEFVGTQGAGGNAGGGVGDFQNGSVKGLVVGESDKAGQAIGI